jgi:uncharacterized protein (TIGR02646 family)
VKKQTRLQQPQILGRSASKWTEKWIQRRNANKPWRWPVEEGIPINRIISEPLKQQTDAHCSFCDSFPVETVSGDTIEHFKPKSKFPESAFDWHNLFYCCARCQTSKREKFDDLLLKPDAENYSFSRYFNMDFTKGTIVPNPMATPDDQARAATTISLYGLNEYNRPNDRIRWIEKSSQAQLHDCPYRFMFDP